MHTDFERQRKDITTAMDYAVPEEFRAEAEDLLEIYRDDRIGLILLLEFYSYLPEAREDWIREVRLIKRHQGIFLLAVRTPAHLLPLPCIQ